MTAARSTASASEPFMTPMARVIREIVRAAGVEQEYDTAREFSLVVKNGSWMDLHIESFPAGPIGSGAMYDNLDVGGKRHVSVAHYFRQGDESIPDPELEMNELGYPFVLDQQKRWVTHIIARDVDTGRVMLNPRAKQSVMQFTNMWARNLRAQGFVQAAKEMGKAKAQATGEQDA